MGRPNSDNPKGTRLGVRVDAETLKRLQAYCEENNISSSEAIRRAINLLIGETKK